MISSRRTFISALGASVAVPSLSLATAEPKKSLPFPVGAQPDGSGHPMVGKPLPKWKPGEFQVHHIHTGVAESSLWILPDGTSMLLDCGDHPAIHMGKDAVPILPYGNRYAGDWISCYVARANPCAQNVDYMMLTHYHSDHSGGHRGGWGDGVVEWKGHRLANSGFVQAAQRLRFVKAFDRCYPTYDQPIPCEKGSVDSLDFVKKMYPYLIERYGVKVEQFKVGAVNQIAMRKSPGAYKDFSITNVCGNGLIRRRDGSLRDLFAGVHETTNWIDENGASAGVVAQYGAFRFISCGDFAGGIKQQDGSYLNAELELAKELDPVDVAKINHHGFCCTPPGYVAALQPRVWTSCIWSQAQSERTTMANISSRKDQKGPRLIIPTVFPADRRLSDAGSPWVDDIAPESFKGCHVVITVQPGGKTYNVACLTAYDESMMVVGAYDFASKGIRS